MTYEIEVGQFVPTFAIYSNIDGVRTINDESLFEWTYVQMDRDKIGSEFRSKIAAIPC